MAIVPEYWPSQEILAMSEVDRHDRVLSYKRASLAMKDIA
jgi:hypothetical protein